MLDDDPPADNGHVAETAELVVARERIRELEERVTLLQGQLDQERRRNAELVNELKSAQEGSVLRWLFRRRKG